jgi:hypothetical protein
MCNCHMVCPVIGSRPQTSYMDTLKKVNHADVQKINHVRVSITSKLYKNASLIIHGHIKERETKRRPKN